MTVHYESSDIRTVLAGFRVERASATLPQTGASSLFTVSGGRVIVTHLVGEVTVVLGATATTLKLTANPTVGSDTDITATQTVTSDEVGTLYSMSGLITDNMQVSGSGSGGVSGQSRWITIASGTIDLVSNSNNTGEVKWSLCYWPLDDGATVVAA